MNNRRVIMKNNHKDYFQTEVSRIVDRSLYGYNKQKEAVNFIPKYFPP